MPAWRSSRDEFRTQWKASIVATLAAVWCRSGVGIGPPPWDAPLAWNARSRFWMLKPFCDRPPCLVTGFSPAPVGRPPVSPMETIPFFLIPSHLVVKYSALHNSLEISMGYPFIYQKLGKAVE